MINAAAEYKKGVFPVPEAFSDFDGYLDVKRRKIKEHQMKSPELRSHAEAIASLMLKPIMASSPTWVKLQDDLQSLSRCLLGYCEYLDNQAAKTAFNSKLLNPLRSVSEFCTVHECSQVDVDDVKDKYRLLDCAVRAAGTGTPVMFDENIHLNTAFKSNFQRFYFFEHVHLSVVVDMLKYSPGGSHTTVASFIEVKPNRSESERQTDSARFLAGIMPKLPIFHTRAMKKNFKQKIQNLASIKPSLVTFLYSELGWDSSAASNPAMQQRLHMIFAGECGLLPDLRVLNPGRPNDKYDTFFHHLETVINSVTAEDERRHNVAHMSQWLSLKDLVSQATALCPPDTPIPSTALVRLQFTPRNAYSHAALSFTSRYQVQYKIQRRQLRLSHPDDHYCAALLKYIKTLAVNLAAVGVVQLYFCDDKAKVPVGEPDVALSTGVRGKMCIAPVETTVAAADHDVNHKGSLTPSVLLQCEIPPSVDNSFVRGQVTVFVNDSVFQTSNPFRHAVQLIQTVRERECEQTPSVLLKFTDGGTDHRNTLESVKCAMICIFKVLDIDFLVAARCAPGQSWTNPAERVMSILNIGLQNCSLSRQRVDDDVEKALKKCNGMDDMRSSVLLQPSIRTGWTTSVEGVQNVIRSRFERLALKDKGILTREPVDDEAIVELKKNLLQLFPSIDLNKLVKSSLVKNAAYQAWLQKHCKQSLYAFQVRKCDDENCCVRKIELCPWLPDPMLSADLEHFQPFDEVYGTDTSERDRPTLKSRLVPDSKAAVPLKSSSGGESVGLATPTVRPSELKAKAGSTLESFLYDKSLLADAGMYTAQNARSVIECVECRKPRVVYAASHQWGSRNKLELALILSENDYTCGSPLTSPKDSLHGKVFTRLEMTCESYIELAYYGTSNAIGKKPGLCCYCAVDDTPRDAILTAKYKTVLPVCDTCKLQYEPVCLRPYGKSKPTKSTPK